MRDELAFLIERADINAEKLARMSSLKADKLDQTNSYYDEKSATTSTRENSENIKPAAGEYDNDGGFDQNIGGSEVERELITALKRAR